jgi:hypothetical protein
MRNYKEKILDCAIQGLVDGGMKLEAANLYFNLLARIYDSGYNEAVRKYEYFNRHLNQAEHKKFYEN